MSRGDRGKINEFIQLTTTIKPPGIRFRFLRRRNRHKLLYSEHPSNVQKDWRAMAGRSLPWRSLAADRGPWPVPAWPWWMSWWCSLLFSLIVVLLEHCFDQIQKGTSSSFSGLIRMTTSSYFRLLYYLWYIGVGTYHKNSSETQKIILLVIVSLSQ